MQFQRKSLKGMSDWFAKPVVWVQVPPFPPLLFPKITIFPPTRGRIKLKINTKSKGKVAEWSKAMDCKSVEFILHRFKSYLSQKILFLRVFKETSGSQKNKL
jgi:hypothetical protein